MLAQSHIKSLRNMETGLNNSINGSEEYKTWDCRSCELQFNSKGKWDAHHRKNHQKLAITRCADNNKQSVK